MACLRRRIANALNEGLGNFAISGIKGFGVLDVHAIENRIEPIENHAQGAEVASGAAVGQLLKRHFQFANGAGRAVVGYDDSLVQRLDQQGGNIPGTLWPALAVAGLPFPEASVSRRIAIADGVVAIADFAAIPDDGAAISRLC
jgi:hypothetical protein